METAAYHIVPALAAAIFVACLGTMALRSGLRPAWWLVATAATLFAGWTGLAVATGGWTGFWAEHVRNAWSNQIWLDLLCAGALAFALLVPRARAVGMRAWPWALLVLATGSVGLLAMAARCLWLEGAARGAAD